MHGEDREITFSEVTDLDTEALAYAVAQAHGDTAQRHVLRDDFIRALIPFADRLASRYRTRIEYSDDIRQVARLGLVKTVDRYDPQRGSFTAFAVITITGEMKRHTRDNAWRARVHRGLQELSMEVDRATTELTQTLARTPTVREVACRLGVSEEDVRSARLCKTARHPVSLSMPVGQDGHTELGDLVGVPDETLEAVADRVAVVELMRHLPPDVRRMIIMRFYGNLTQTQIGTVLGISQMHVSRLIRRGLAWLRAAMLGDTLPLWNQVDQYTTASHRHRESQASAPAS
ncbi:sigma-70 family RNA polymerase sigma factor [Paractinoplanes lichenicola]|uniref:Sigma-70 family RNA polymerase sigma factor n=1 Tax=Paractinoplanes lichenicola TaxID=2802976 RepID=A0ABS1W0P1_9ACTN|nr:sigma-70 family RNA polymerase sigma factor [Actinoplanes lichenicola]MBL7260275.1 sigma-70 family RNA polymerase sigma factor [Actinoplanes lichenicola]